MDRRQSADRNRMRTGDRQFFVTIIKQASPEEHRVAVEIGTSKRAFYCDFPDACGAEQKRVAAILD